MNLKYISSNGNELDFNSDLVKVTAGSWHTRSWSPKVVNALNGQIVKGFSKDSVTYQTTITLRADLQTRYVMLDEISEMFEVDIINQSPGRLVFGDWHIPCYAIASDTKRSSTYAVSRTDLIVDFYCPESSWIRTETKEFYASGIEVHSGVDYPHDYPFDYTASQKGFDSWENDSYTSADMDLTIYGPCTDPSVMINGNIHQVYGTVEEGAYLTISTKGKTIVKTALDGEKTNIFDNRNKQFECFKKVPSGELEIAWDNTFGFDMTLYQERSEPKWISS